MSAAPIRGYFHQPVTQRFSYMTKKMYTLPALTDLQLAALAAARDGDVERYEKRVGYERYVAYRAHGFDVTCQMQALRKRRLIWFRAAGDHQIRPSPAGLEVLKEHPEF